MAEPLWLLTVAVFVIKVPTDNYAQVVLEPSSWPCNVVGRCTSAVTETYFGDPGDCTRYYRCERGTLYIETCGELHWDNAGGKCSHPGFAECESPCPSHYNIDYRVVCYYPSWARYRAAPVTFTPANVPYANCTHLIFAFGKISGTLQTLDPPNDEVAYRKLVSFRNQLNPSLRLLLSVGGANTGSEPYTAVVSTSTTRQRFVRSAVSYLQQHSLDGLDLDWEFPTQRGSTPEDRGRYTLLIQSHYITFHAYVTVGRSEAEP